MNFQEFKVKYQNLSVKEISTSPPQNPIVSVLVQTYQQKSFIRDCLDSILMQETSFDFEILIGEDGSRDGTREICLEYAEKYPEKIRLFLHHRENQIKVLGEATSNFNAFYNLYSARGKYIAFCEGDDYWMDPLKLQKQVEFLEKNGEFVLCFHKFLEINKNSAADRDRVLDQVLQNIPQENLKRLNFHPLLSTVCFRNKIRELPWEITQIINVDSFLISLLGHYGKAKFQDEIEPGIYRRHSGGAWSGRKKELKYRTKINTFHHLAAYYKKQNNRQLQDYFTTVKRNYYKILFLHLIKHFEFRKASRLLPELAGKY